MVATKCSFISAYYLFIIKICNELLTLDMVTLYSVAEDGKNLRYGEVELSKD